uniref:Uncharacterized protein n=1 Tax=Anguilla anguilla TaxID=7936 RepID=A0A0E9WS83_ANGAN
MKHQTETGSDLMTISHNKDRMYIYLLAISQNTKKVNFQQLSRVTELKRGKK